MAKSIAQWQDSIVATVMGDAVLGPLLTSTSNVAIWYLWTYVVAVCAAGLDNLFDFHKAEVKALINAQKAGKLQWYVTMAKAFQYGDTLPADTDQYAVIAPAGDASLIVSFADAVETTNTVRIKVATGAVGSLSALSGPQLTALRNYMGRVKYAGVRINVTSGAGDTFQPTMTIYYDPLVLDNTGARLDTTAATPVKDAINAFLTSLPFNGIFILNKFTTALEAVDGVVIADEVSVQAFYASTPPVIINTALPPQYVPDSGYLVLDESYFNAHITYEPYA